MRGFLDGSTARRVSGWALDEQGNPPLLQVWVNGQTVYEFVPAALRPDLPSACAFDVDIGRVLQNGDTLGVTSRDGQQHLGGSPARVTGQPVTRMDKAFWLARRDMKILEIGPSFGPLAPRSAGWNCYSLDCATAEELRIKYADQPTVSSIEEVDFVWRNGSLADAVPADQHGTFDYVLASHVFEHAPDPIGFLHSIAKLLRAEGLLCLALPDKRRMFDFFRQITVTSDWLVAIGQTRHSPKAHFDNAAYPVTECGQIIWPARAMGSNWSFMNTLEVAKAGFDRTLSQQGSGDYVDLHATVSTPASFELILLEVGQLGLLPFHIVKTFPGAIEFEYWLTLQKGAPERLPDDELRRQRLRLMNQSLREQAEAARWLLDEA